MKAPYFSIITCTYNAKRHVNECLDSIRCQNFDSYEHIIVDGYSSDGTYELLQKYAAERPSACILERREPKGLVEASNYAIKKARGKYLIFIHSDDLLHDADVLRDCQGILRTKDEPDWVYGQICVINDLSKKIGVFPNHKIFQKASPYLLKFFNYIPHQAVFMKAEVFKKYGLYTTNPMIEWVMDYEYWLRISRRTKWLYINRLIANYRQWEGSNTQSGKLHTTQIEQRKYLQKQFQNYGEATISSIINFVIDRYAEYKGKHE